MTSLAHRLERRSPVSAFKLFNGNVARGQGKRLVVPPVKALKNLGCLLGAERIHNIDGNVVELG